MDLPISAISSSIQRGDILLSDFSGIDHQKFFAVMGVYENRVCGFFFVNSNINSFIMRKQEFLELQYPLRKIDYPFLKYDSFLCASSVKERTIESISQGIQDGTTRVISRLKDEHISDIVNMVLESEVISDLHKEMYFL